MLRVNDKKIDTAFGRLRKRRESVGLISTAETPEQEAKRIEDEFKSASASGNIGALLSIITRSSKLSIHDYVKNTCGELLFLYYSYINHFHMVPVDLIDMVDGILYMDAENYIKKDALEKSRSQ